jgi:hypothetical protein
VAVVIFDQEDITDKKFPFLLFKCLGVHAMNQMQAKHWAMFLKE